MQNNSISFRNTFLLALLIIICLSATSALFFFVRTKDQTRIQLQFERRVDVLLYGIQKKFEEQQNALHALQGLYEVSDVDRDRFRIFADKLLGRDKDVQAFEWIPRIPYGRITKFEDSVNREGFSGFQIKEYDRQKKLVKAGRRDEYYPVNYIVPLKGNERAFGFDLASDPVRRQALIRSCETNELVATGRITLVQETGSQYGFLIFAPVYQRGMPHGTVDERRKNLIGFTLGVFRAGDMIEGVIRKMSSQGLEVQVYNENACRAENMIYCSALTENIKSSLHKIMAFSFAGRTWMVRAGLAEGGFIAEQNSWYSIGVLASGIIFTLLLAAFVRVVSGRAEQVERLVEQRTAELHEANKTLYKTQAQQKAIIENIPHLFWLKDTESRFLEVNELFARSCGYAVTDIIGKTDLDVWPEELAEKYRADDRLVMASGEHKSAEEPIADSSGIHWFETLKAPVFDAQGNVIGTTGLSRNISKRKQAEEELNIQRKSLENIITGTNAGTWVWNVQTGETVFNERWAEIIGYTLEELSSTSIQTWIDLTHPDDLRRSNELIELHFAGKLEYYECECRMKHKNGSWVWVLDRGSVIATTDEGKPLCMTGMHIDITTRKQMEEEIRRQRALLSSLLDSIPFIVFYKDTEGVYLGCNPAFAEFVGRTREQIIGRTDHELFDKDVADFFIENDRRMMDNKVPQHNDEWITYPDGRRILLDTLKTPYWGPAGELLGVLGISRDITVQRHIEETLTSHTKDFARINDDLYREKKQTELILHDIGDGVAVVDLDGRIVMLNAVAKELLGVSETISSTSIAEDLFIHCALSDSQQQIIRGRIPMETFSITVNLEQPLVLEVNCTTLHDEKKRAAGHVYVFHDVTRMQEIDRMKSNFISSVSHELRTPLTSIKGFVKTILSDPQMPEQTRREFLAIIDKEAERLASLIEDVLEISRIEAGKAAFYREPYTIAEIMEKIVPSMQRLAEEKRLKLQWSIHDGLPELTGDSGKIQSVFTNLLSNAIKFTPAGGSIICSAFQDESAVVVQVKDTGLGIPKKDLTRIFERFYRVQRPGTEIPGTGLGLAICQELVKLHGGRIEVESFVNKGTVFSVYLPLTDLSDMGHD